MTLVHHLLPQAPIRSIDDYMRHGGGRAIEAARNLDSESLIAEVEASGLRGRGGAGFPTGRKWRTIYGNRSSRWPSSVVINGAEGEPGTFKDRSILRANPYQVLEGAFVAARAVGAATVIVALKGSFRTERRLIDSSLDEIGRAGWAAGIELTVFDGPNEYLFGEETALLESIDGRAPLPRLAPPYRRGVEEIVVSPADVETGSGLSAHVKLGGPGSEVPPTLVDNVETLANIPRIVSEGGSWFRMTGTAQSPGTIVCTVTGRTRRHGVGEVPMGTPLADVIEAIGGGPRHGHHLTAVLPGVSNGFVTASDLRAPVSYEGFAAIGSGLGAAGFIVFDDTTDLVGVAAGIARFLAVESCGQCTPCKQDGLAIADLLDRFCRGEASPDDLGEIRTLASRVTDGARCALAGQQQTVLASCLDRFPDAFSRRLADDAPPIEPCPIAGLIDIRDGVAEFDPNQRTKQPDWSHDRSWSGKTPADRSADHRIQEPPSP